MGALAGKLHPQGSGICAQQVTDPLASTPLSNTPKLEAYRVELAIGGQMPAGRIARLRVIQLCMSRVRIAQFRVAQVAVQAQGLVIAAGYLESRSAAPREPISQRQPIAMWPELSLVGLGRDKVGTSQRARSLGIILSLKL
jgi:hypothetical protein